MKLLKNKIFILNPNTQFFIVLALLIVLDLFQISIRSKSIIFIGILLSLYLFNNQNYKIKNMDFFGKKNFYLLILFIVLMITQNKYLNFEIISIDIPSYLVASRSENFFEIPFLQQWESKGPVFIYLYRFLLFLSNDNYLFFRILNDLLLFISSTFIFLISYEIGKNYFFSFISSLFFVLVTSHVWYVTELSEIYCLLFILAQYYLLIKYPISKKYIFISGLLISVSSLINQSTAIFIIGVLIFIYFFKKFNEISYYVFLVIGFLIPQIAFYLIYFFNDLSIIYFTNYVKIPFGYVNTGKFEIYELVVWLRRYFKYNEFLYFSIIGLIFLGFTDIIKKNIVNSYNKILNISYLVLGFLIYVIAGHSYQHHLFYSIAFFTIFISNFISKDKVNILSLFVSFLIIISTFQIISTSFNESFNNLINHKETYDNYPLKNLASEIDQIFENKDYNVLAVDHVLLLFYLEKLNISYIVHPFNNFEPYIVDALVNTKKLKTNDYSHLSYYVELEPDVIICSPQTIIDGSPTKIGSNIFNCEVTDYKKNYFKLDTNKYLENPNREYYYDPYISIDVFIKNE